MSANHLAKEFIFVANKTSIFRGNPFVWDTKVQRFKSRNDKYFVATRFFLNVWSIWALFHKTYWWNYGRSQKDQSVTEDMLDNLYVGAAVLCNSVHIALRLTEKSVLAFMNTIVIVNKRHEETYLEKSSKRKRRFDWRWWLTLYLLFLTVMHSAAAAAILLRNPAHRRYTYNVIYLVTPDSWIKYPVTIFHWVRMMNHWGVVLLYIQIGSFYCRLTKHWVVRATAKLDPAENSSGPLETRSLNKSIGILRSMQYLTNYYNLTFGSTNAFFFSGIFGNMLYYCVMMIIGVGVVPMPEYLLFPLAGTGFPAFILILIQEMVDVLVSSEDFIKQVANNKESRKCKSVAKLPKLCVRMAGFFHIAEDASLIFLANLVDYIVNILLTVS